MLGIELSVITVNYNGVADTCAFIDSIPFGECPLEVIVVDNGSRNDEATLIEQRYPYAEATTGNRCYPLVRVIRSERNLGFAGGNNLGIRAARGRYLFLVNNDTILSSERLGERGEGVFLPLINRLESDPSIGIVCPKIRFAWGDRLIQFAGYTPLSSITVRNRSIGCGEADQGQYDDAHATPYAHGAAMMTRREAVERAGLMPECYFLYYEELDWSMMMRRAGYTIWYEPAGTVFHKESQSTGQDSPLRTYYLMRNRLLLVRRNSTSALCRWLSYAYLTGIAAPCALLKHLVRRRPDLAAATIRGVTHFIKS